MKLDLPDKCEICGSKNLKLCSTNNGELQNKFYEVVCEQNHYTPTKMRLKK